MPEMQKTATLFSMIFIGVIVFQWSAFAQSKPRVGKGAAAKYLKVQKADPEVTEQEDSSRRPASSGGDHYLMLGIGKSMSSAAWDWGIAGKEDDVAGNNVTVTYRMGEWVNSMDLHLRIDYNEYNVAGDKATKLGFLPMVTFPDASSRFPLYFGGGLGLGVFFKQVPNESPLALDYQLVIGARFFDIFEHSGFFIETGLKNHLLLTSSGQLNGSFLSGGAVFTF